VSPLATNDDDIGLIGDGIIARASGYGMSHIRVDGNDLLAVYDATVQLTG
jgi:hypothetical protein